MSSVCFVDFSLVSLKADDVLVYFKKNKKDEDLIFVVKENKNFKVVCNKTFYELYTLHLTNENLDLFPSLKSFNILKEF